jgi:dihydrofolate reductase
MGKIVVSEFVPLDGVLADPSWTAPYGGEEQQRAKLEELSEADALLLGRRTYEEFAAAWPRMMEQYEGPGRVELQEYTDLMNGLHKHVVSTTLEEPLEWGNSTLIKGDVAEEISKLKQQPGKDIVVFGSGALVRMLMEHDLVDEYRLMVFPILLGGGRRLFGDSADRKPLQLLDLTTFVTGVVYLTYRPAEEAVRS